MTKPVLTTALAAVVALSAVAPTAQAQSRRSGAQRTQEAQVAQIPRCTRNLGTITIADGQADVFRELQLSPPQSLLRVVIQRSGCFTLLDRGVGMSVAQRERELAGQGNLQRGSNVGGGQVRAADFVLVGEVASQNSNSGGSAVAGIAGALLGGTAGALIGGIRTRRSEANVVLSLTDVRTSETALVTEGYASKNDMGWSAGAGGVGSTGFGGAVGGGYENTEIGRIVSQAFISAYADMVTQMGGMGEAGSAAAAAPVESYTVQQATTLRAEARTNAAVVRALPVGLRVYPTGNRNGPWWEVIDDNDNTGWVQNERLAQSQ